MQVEPNLQYLSTGLYTKRKEADSKRSLINGFEGQLFLLVKWPSIDMDGRS